MTQRLLGILLSSPSETAMEKTNVEFEMVNENSFAEAAGLMVGDVIVRVNDIPTVAITHAMAHDLIDSAGCKFVMAVRRGLFSDIPVPSEECDNAEIENILKQSLAEQIQDIEKDQALGLSPTILENLAGQEQLIDSTKGDNVSRERVNKPKKWSTFLVKPKNPKPAPKKLQEERKIIGEPYRVKIIKQPRRDPKDVINRKKTVQFEPQVVEVEISQESSIADSNEFLEISELNQQPEMELEDSIEVTEEIYAEIKDVNENIVQDQQSDRNDSPQEETFSKPKSILKPAPLDIHIDPVICESSLSLEQQLAAVQKQLLALAQLPSAIQVTLEAVTQQLNKIVLEKSQTPQTENNVANGEQCEENASVSDGTLEEDNIDENASISENAEGDITENEAEDQHNFDDLENDEIVNDNYETNINENEKEEEKESTPEKAVELDPYAGLTEEEKEAKKREEQILAKKQKIEEERRKMDWTQRPIVLPGGRKWSDPEDATPKVRTPKMSDEKICKAIEENSEVIVGKIKGSTTGTKFGRGETNKSQSTGMVNVSGWNDALLNTSRAYKNIDGMIVIVCSSRESNCFMVPSKAASRMHQLSKIRASPEESRLPPEVRSLSPDSRHGAPSEGYRSQS